VDDISKLNNNRVKIDLFSTSHFGFFIVGRQVISHMVCSGNRGLKVNKTFIIKMIKIRQLGFTLIEMMLTLSLVAIIAVAAVPMMGDLINTSQVRGAAEHMYSNIQLARSEAVKSNQPMRFSFTSGSGWCYGFSTVANCNCGTQACQSNTGAVSNTALSEDSSTYSSGINLQPNGSVLNNSNNPTNLTLKVQGTGSRVIKINLSALGQVSLCSSTVSGYSSCP